MPIVGKYIAVHKSNLSLSVLVFQLQSFFTIAGTTRRQLLPGPNEDVQVRIYLLVVLEFIFFRRSLQLFKNFRFQ